MKEKQGESSRRVMETNQMLQQQEDEIEIDVVGILLDLWRKAPLIILVGILTAAIGFLYSSFGITPMYQSTTKMYVLSRQDENKGTTYSDMQMGTLLTNDYAEMIKSRQVIETVIDELGLDMTYGQLLSEITISVPTSTRIIALTVKDASPVNAMKIADTTREVASEHIKNVMNIEAVNVVETANLPTQKCEPSVPKYTVLGGAIGVFLMCAFFAIRFILNDAIRTPDDIEKKLGLSCLAVVPVNPNIKKKKGRKK